MNRKRGMLLLAVLAAVAVPLGATAQIAAPQNTVIEVENYDTHQSPPTSYINKAMCADAAGAPAVKLEWHIPGANSGTYQLYATDLDPAYTPSPDTGSCLTHDTTITNADHFAGPIGNRIAVASAVQQATVSGAALSDAASGAQQACAADRKVIFVCAHWYDGSATRSGYASGRFVIQLAAPATPASVSVVPAAGSLDVSWTPVNGGAAPSHHFMVMASPVDPDGLPMPGDEFMKTVFTLNPMDVGTAMNTPKSVVYVIQVQKFGPGNDTLWQRFLQDEYPRYASAGNEDREAARLALRSELEKEAGLKWKRKADQPQKEKDEPSGD